jgi:hypothetical protein
MFFSLGLVKRGIYAGIPTATSIDRSTELMMMVDQPVRDDGGGEGERVLIPDPRGEQTVSVLLKLALDLHDGTVDRRRPGPHAVHVPLLKAGEASLSSAGEKQPPSQPIDRRRREPLSTYLDSKSTTRRASDPVRDPRTEGA